MRLVFYGGVSLSLQKGSHHLHLAFHGSAMQWRPFELHKFSVHEPEAALPGCHDDKQYLKRTDSPEHRQKNICDNGAKSRKYMPGRGDQAQLGPQQGHEPRRQHHALPPREAA